MHSAAFQSNHILKSLFALSMNTLFLDQFTRPMLEIQQQHKNIFDIGR